MTDKSRTTIKKIYEWVRLIVIVLFFISTAVGLIYALEIIIMPSNI